MVNTRSTARKQALLEQNQQLTVKAAERQGEQKEQAPENVGRVKDAEPGTSGHAVAPSCILTRKSSRKSSSASIITRKKQLELAAAEAKARIEMQLIDKRLQADMAALEDECSSHSEEHEVLSTKSDVERWLERSQHERLAQPVQQDGLDLGELCPPAGKSGGTEGTIHMLASALKDMIAISSKSNAPNARLLSRISTQKDLPVFAGDPLEWLYFKQAYHESTEVCQFSPRENLWRLRSCLRGPAKEAVTALLISATTPDTVMDALELQFGNTDVIISRIVQDVQRLPTMSQEYHKDIVKFSVKVQNFVAAVIAIGEDEYLKNMNIMSAVLSKFPTVLLSKWTDYSYPLIIDGTKAKLIILSDFLREEAVKTTKTAVNISSSKPEHSGNYQNKRKYNENYASKSHNVLLQSDTSTQGTKICRFCRSGSKHKLPDCKAFKKALRKDRWSHVKRYGICYRCLLDTNHNHQACQANTCDQVNSDSTKCGLSHHRLLHYNFNRNNTRQDCTTEASGPAELEPNVETQQVTNIKESNHRALLKMITVQIHGSQGIETTSALLDDGSTVTLISSDLANRLGLRGHKKTMRVCGAWDDDGLECDSEIVNLTISNRDGQLFNLKANSVNNLNLPTQDTSSLCIDRYKHITEIKDQISLQYSKPQILIGQDNYDLLLPLQVLEGKSGEPYATLTPLGWCLHGRTRTQASRSFQNSTLLLSWNNCDLETESEYLLREMHEEVRRSFAVDSLGVNAAPRENVDDLRAKAHLEKTCKLIDQRWYVGLPWKDDNAKMPNSFPSALTRLKGIERKMKTDAGYAERYKERIDHLFENDFAKEISDISMSTKTWYLPHFGVDNPNKKKLRLVFDAAAKCQSLNLNDYLLKGPDLLVSLLGIMMRFREQRIGLTGDIKDMFLRIKILPEDQDALRFLWRDHPTDKLKVCAMTSLIFGVNCSPFIAQFIKNKNAQRYESSRPAAIQAICEQHYMDDYIDSVEDIASAKHLIKDITYIHSQGGFEIRNWTSNCEEVLDSIPTEALGPTAVRFNIAQSSERTLGLIWFPKKDVLSFDVSFKRIPANMVSGEIDELTGSSEWHYVPTKHNIADVGTREDCNIAVFSGEWPYGPSFLSSDSSEWPEDLMRAAAMSQDNTENITRLPACPDPERFSSWLRLQKTTCIVLSFIDKKCKKLTYEVDGAMMKHAEQLLIKYAQAQLINGDLEHLEKGKTLDKTSKLLTLTPYLDEHGHLLRVQDRTDAVPGIARSKRRPKILDGHYENHERIESSTTEALTTNGFILGTSSNFALVRVLHDSGPFLREQWCIPLVLAGQLWRRWAREILPLMLPRRKWHGESAPPWTGDLVDSVVNVVTGPAGRGWARVSHACATTTKTGLLRRPVSRVAILPVGDEC